MNECEQNTNGHNRIRKALLKSLSYEGGAEGPYCPYCTNARQEWEANKEAFDIFDHVQRCLDRLRNPLPTVAEMTGSDPDFTGDLSTEEYVRRTRE